MLRLLVEAAVGRGLRRDELLQDLGIPPELLADPEARVPHEVMRMAWEEIPHRLGDPAFGVHLAEGARPGSLELLDYVTSHSPDLGSAYRKLVRYQRLIHHAAGMRFEIVQSADGNGDGDKDRARLSHQIPTGLSISRHAPEFFMAGSLALGRRLVGPGFSPLCVEFAHAAPPDTTEHRRFFRTEVLFDRPLTVMSFDADRVSRPLPGADPALSRVLERYAEQLLAAQPPVEESFLDRARRLVCGSLSAELPRAADVARRLGVSERTLLRRLREGGLSYQSLVDSVRKDMALKRLQAPDATPAEVGFFLGFSDVSTFYRAFRRWTGSTPAEFRGRKAAPANQLAAPVNAPARRRR
jgi:AraC-like DNA-binding protein